MTTTTHTMAPHTMTPQTTTPNTMAPQTAAHTTRDDSTTVGRAPADRRLTPAVLDRDTVRGVPGQPRSRHTGRSSAPSRAGILAGSAGLLAVGAAVLVAPHVPDHALLHEVALLAHLVTLALGLGAVLLMDLTGARWMLRRVSLADVARLAALAHPAIWLGVVGLVLSGALLHPDPTSGLTAGKLVAVVLLCANGGYATALSRDISLAAVAGDRLPRPLLLRALASGTLSQAAWWTAVVVGFLNTRS